MNDLAEANRTPPANVLDVLIQLKIADFYFAVGDVGFDDVNEICPTACRHALESWNITPLIPIEELRQREPRHIALAESFAARPVRMPAGAVAGNYITRIRKVGDAYKAALTRECALEDGTPQSNRALTVTDRRLKELETLRDEILEELNRPYDARSDDGPHSLATVEELTVLCELLNALYPHVWKEHEHSGIGRVLSRLQWLGTFWSNDYLDRAKRWNASQGGANV